MRFFCLIAVLALAGCQSAPPVGSDNPLVGTAWLAWDINGRGPGDKTYATLVFNPGRISGSGGCNRFSGVLDVKAEAWQASDIELTRMECAPELMKEEASFIGALEAARSPCSTSPARFAFVWCPCRGRRRNPGLSARPSCADCRPADRLPRRKPIGRRSNSPTPLPARGSPRVVGLAWDLPTSKSSMRTSSCGRSPAACSPGNERSASPRDRQGDRRPRPGRQAPPRVQRQDCGGTRKETVMRQNRWMLMSGAIAVALAPLINIHRFCLITVSLRVPPQSCR